MIYNLFLSQLSDFDKQYSLFFDYVSLIAASSLRLSNNYYPMNNWNLSADFSKEYNWVWLLK